MVTIEEVPDSTPIGSSIPENSRSSIPAWQNPGPGYVNLSAGLNLLEGAGRFWHQLKPDEKPLFALLVALLAWAFYYYWLTALLIFFAFEYFSRRKPSEQSFGSFFKAWFLTQYYPRMADAMERDMERRRAENERRGGILESLGEAVKGHLMNKTRGLQARFVYEAVIHNANPLIFVDRGIFLEVTINLGTKTDPNYATFLGFHENWFLAPYLSINFDKPPFPLGGEQQLPPGYTG